MLYWFYDLSCFCCWLLMIFRHGLWCFVFVSVCVFFDLFVSLKILRVFCICVGLLVSRYDFSLIVRWLLSFFPLFSFILLNVSYIVQQRSKHLDSKSWMCFRVNLFVFYWTDNFAGSWKLSENFRSYFAARVPAHLAVVPSWTTSGTLRSQFFPWEL